MSIDYVKLITEVIKSYEEDKKEYIQHKKPQKGDTYNDIFRKETDQERRERIEQDNANIQRVDNQIKR